MWGRQEHIFTKGYLGVVSLGKACRWRGEEEGGGASLPLPCTWPWGMGPTLNLSTSSSTAGDTSASESNGVRRAGGPTKDPVRNQEA